MEKGKNFKTEMFISLIGIDKQKSINEYLSYAINNEYKDLNVEQLNDFFTNDRLNYDDYENLKYYSGYYYKYINSLKRGVWDYDMLGEKKDTSRYEQKANNITKILLDKGDDLQDNFKTYRGVNINYFSNYGINDTKDLPLLKNKFFLDQAFVSTTPIKEMCYYNRETGTNITYNVLMEYDIPKIYEQGIFIGRNSLTSYSPLQKEYLLNSDTLSYVEDVIIKDDKAIIKLLAIPLQIYDDYYIHNPKESKKR